MRRKITEAAGDGRRREVVLAMSGQGAPMAKQEGFCGTCGKTVQIIYKGLFVQTARCEQCGGRDIYDSAEECTQAPRLTQMPQTGGAAPCVPGVLGEKHKVDSPSNAQPTNRIYTDEKNMTPPNQTIEEKEPISRRQSVVPRNQKLFLFWVVPVASIICCVLMLPCLWKMARIEHADLESSMQKHN